MNEDQEFCTLLERIKRERGLDCRQYKVNFLKRRLAVRLRARGVESYREYARLLDDEEYEKLFEALTINLSYFLRDRTTFEALREKVLKPLIQERESRGKRYFIPFSDREYSLQPEIKTLVQFEQHDLLADPPPRHLDLILCRNVLIYFSRQQQERLFAIFHEALNEGRYLVTDKTEILLPFASKLFKPLDWREHIYMKR